MIGVATMVLLSLPGLWFWWWLHHAIDPHIIRGIPAPRVRYTTREADISPTFNDWRGFV